MEYTLEQIKKMNIYEKMSNIEHELDVSKTLKVMNYKAFSEKDVKNACKELEFKYRVKSNPTKKEIVLQDIFDNGGRKTYFERMKITYEFINIDKPDEKFCIDSFGDGIDPQDKSVGKAQTYAHKYALMDAYKIATGDDPDKVASKSVVVSAVKKMITDEQKKEFARLKVIVSGVLKYFNVVKVDDLTYDQAKLIIDKKKEKANENTK